MLHPAAMPAPLQGQALNRFIQKWMADVLGAAALAPELIRPYSQANPPVIPDSGIAWMAFRQYAEGSDTFPYLLQKTDGTGATLQRHEQLRVLCSFYDTGVNGEAAMLASLLRDNLAVPDNLELLQLNGFGMVGCDAEVAVPSLLNERWLYRVDLPFRLNRLVTRDYAVPNIEIADGTLHNDVGLPDVPLLVVENP